MINILNFLDKHSGAASVLVTISLVIVTIIYVILTWRLAKEAKTMRRLQSEPKVIVFYRLREESINIADLVIKNIGLGAAYNIKLNLSSDFKYRTGEMISTINLLKNGIVFLGPNEEKRFWFANLVEQYKTHEYEKLNIVITYFETFNFKNKKNPKRESFEIDLTENYGLVLAQNPPLAKIANHLEKIENELKKMFDYSPQLKVISYTPQDIINEAKLDEEIEKNEKKGLE
jgi:hypothetical protein